MECFKFQLSLLIADTRLKKVGDLVANDLQTYKFLLLKFGRPTILLKLIVKGLE
jgi:hypothetical protein